VIDREPDRFTRWINPPFMATLKAHSNGSLYINAVIGTLAVDGWAVTFGTAKRGLGGPHNII